MKMHAALITGTVLVTAMPRFVRGKLSDPRYGDDAFIYGYFLGGIQATKKCFPCENF